MQQQSVRNLDAREFEWVCSGIIGEIAKVYGDVPTGPSELMAPSTDGGIEAKIPTTSGWLAVQCKAYPGAGFDKEIGSIKRSFTTFLGRPEHGGVTRYIWCSTADRTGGTGVSGAKHSSPGNDAKAKQAIAAMTAEAAKRGRTVDVAIRFATDLDEIVRTERPEYAAVMASLTPFRLEDVRRYSAARAGSILTRLGGELAPQLEFPAPRTADLLDRLSDSTRPNGRIRLDGLTELIDELHRREHALPAASPLVTDVRDACAAVLAAGTAVQGSLTLSATELEAPLTELRDRSAAVSTLARTTVGARLPLPEDSEDERPVLKAILRVAASAAALHTHAELLACEAEAARTRRLLISGAWGTGKSYQLAEYTRRASDAGIPVLLLRARDFTATDDPILAQPWRGAFENRNAEPTEIAAMLDAIGHRSVRDGGSPLVLIVDGLNEASIRDLPVALQRLFDTVGRFPSLRLVLSNREDRMPVADGGVPEFHHDRPERAVLSRAVERTLNAPAGTRWHAVVSNPLLASVAVRVISARPDQADRVLSRTGLFEAWVDLLSDEAAAALQMPRATVQRIIGTITHAGGSSDITGIARKAETPAPIVDRVVDRLIDEGLLESAGDDAVRVHWDGLSETLRMRRAIADGSVDALFRELPSGKRESALALLAELLPQAERRLELPDFPVPNVTDDQRDFAFALSLNERTDGSIHAGTGVLAERMLRAGGDAGQAVLWSVLSVPGRSRIGVTWLCDILRSTPLAQRSRFWPTILEDLCERSPSDQDDMEELLSWLSTERWPELSEDQADPVVEILTWMTCANDHTGLPGFAVSSLVEIAHRHPTLLKTVLGRVADVDDDHPRDALFAAAAGIIARWPESPSAHIVRDVCTDALRSDLAVQSYASLAAIHRAIDSRVPMHAFLDHALPPLRVRRLRFSPRRRDLIRDDDRAMFADARSERDAERFETDILDAMGVPVTGRDAVVDIGDAFDGHGLSLVRGRWLARQYAKHPFGARLSVGFVPVKAGTSENPATEMLEDPDGAWRTRLDPTVPVALMLRDSDAVPPRRWWVPRIGPLGSGGHSAQELEVTDPEGTVWVVIDGRFRLLDPAHRHHDQRATLRLGRHRWMLGDDDDDGLPAIGRTRHDVIRIDDARLIPMDAFGPEPVVSRRAIRHDLFADAFTILPEDGSVVVPAVDGSVAPLSAVLPRLLGAHWTGWGLDGVDGDGVKVFTDPAAGLSAPHAVLVRRDALSEALARTGTELTLAVTVSDMRSSFHGSRPVTVVLTAEA